jgi:hypothetical protein
LKKVVTYSLLILVLFAFNYKAVNHLLNLSKDSTELAQDIDNEEEKSDSKKSNEKEEKTECLEHSIVSNLFVFHSLKTLSSPREITLFFQTSNFSNMVDMPPKHIL